MDACCFWPRSKRLPLTSIRVVHLDGLIEDYQSSITIDEIVTIFPKHFMTTPLRVLQIGLIPLKPDTQLEPGRIYFLLPYAILRFNDSSDNLIILTRKLTKIAKTRKFKTKKAKTHQITSKLPPSASPQVKISIKISLTRKLSNIAKTHRSKTKQAMSDSPQDNKSSQISDEEGSTDMRRSTKGRFSWKPLLSTIREFSFNRRESDLSFNRRDSLERD